MRNFPSSTWTQSRVVTNKLTLSRSPEVNQVENPNLLAIVVFVVIVVQSILQGSAKLLARSVMDVANQTILYPCVDLGIDLNLKTKETFLHTVPINLMVLSRINRTDHVMTSMRSTKITLIHMTMNKTLLLWCSIRNSGTRM